MTTLSKSRRIITQTFIGLTETNQRSVILQLQDKIKELQQAVLELQNSQLASRAVDTDGMPLNNSSCEVVGGQWLRLVQTAAAPMIVKVTHGLRRKPQGMIWTFSGNSNNQVLIAGDSANNIEAANSLTVSIRLNGANGDTHVGILF